MSVNEPWNRVDLKCPPRFTVATPLKPSEVEKVQDMKLVMNEAFTSLSGMKIFHKEAALLSRFLYRYKRAFRQEKGVQNLVKIHQAIQRYEKIDLAQVLLHFIECIPCNITWTTTESYLPTRQMLKWVLLRILATSKLMTRIIEMSEKAGKYLFGRLRLGWSAHYMIFGIAVTGRIMSCAKYLLLSFIVWYRRLIKYINVLTETARFLPNFKFPRKVEEIIGDIDLDPPSRRDNFDTMFELIDLTVEEDQEKKPEQEDDVIITNEILFRTVSANERNQQQRPVPSGERTDHHQSDSDMAIVFEKKRKKKRKKKMLQPLPAGASSELARPIPSTSGLSPNLSLPSTSTGRSASRSSTSFLFARRAVDNDSSDDSDYETRPPKVTAKDDSDSEIICLDRDPHTYSRHFKNGLFKV